MIRYTEEKKAAALKRMMAPESCFVAKWNGVLAAFRDGARQVVGGNLWVSAFTLYNYRAMVE